MKRYEYVRIRSKKWIGARFEESRQIIDEYAAKGFRYVGFLPVVMNDYGKYRDIDLVFEETTEGAWN